MAHLRTILRILIVLVILFFFLVSIDLLGGSFNLLGKDYVHTLFSANLNPFVGLFVGMLATVLVQSSSVTTSIVVGLVSGGIVSVSDAVPIVMGANIGTTVTNLIVSFGHISQREDFRRAFSGAVIHDFSNQIFVILLFPLEYFTGFLEKTATFLSNSLYGMMGVTYKSPIKIAVKHFSGAIQDFWTGILPFSQKIVGVMLIVLAIVLIFICLFGLVKILRTIMIKRVVQILNRALAKSAIITILIGVIITALVQSSSITTSLLVPLVGGEIITLETAFPIVLGANIGTTVTALLASLAATQAGLTIALVHLLFNMCGILLIYPLKFTRRIPLALARWMGGVVYTRRKIAVLYVFIVFFVIPFLVVIISKSLD